MPPKGPKPQQQPQPPQQQQQQQHVDPLAPSTTHFSAASGQSVVAFLSKVTGAKPATSGTAPPTSGGALEYLNQQNKAKKANAAPKQQQQQQQVSPPPQEAAPAAAPAKGGKPQQAQVQQQPTPQVPHPKKGGKAPIHVVPEPQQQQPSKPQEPSARPKPRSAVEAVTGGKPQQPKKQHQQQQQQGNAAAQNANAAPAAAAEPAAPVDPAQLELEAAKRLTYETFVNALYKQEARPDSTPLLDIPALLEVIRDHQVTMVCTDTGTGKSSALPNALLDANPANRIVSSQPRRTATMSIAGHVAGMRGERIGDSVGYWIRGAKAGDDNTRLWYLTSYTLLLQLLGHPEVPYTHIILDEFHERQPDLEVTMALLRLALRRGANFKLILVSATLNFDDWAKYLEGLDVALFQQSEVEHRVWDFGSEQFCPLLGMAVPMPSQLSFADNGYVDNAIFVAQYLISFINSHCAPHHAALIFLPGRAQVEMFTMWIETAAANRITPIPWHSAVELSTIQAAIRKPAGTKQKLYIATDIAEVSITIPDLVFVIDLGLVKRPQINVQLEASIMFPPLSTQFVSQSSLNQRRGRVGRTQQGFYFSILPTEIVRQLPEHNVAPIQNSRIDELALHVLQVVENPIALFSLCCGQPAIESVLTSMRTLTDAGCIVPERKKEEDDEEAAPRSAWNQPIMADAGAAVDEGVSIERYSATFVGKLAQVLPVSVSQAMLVFYGFLTGLESLMILAAACANLPIPYVVAAPTNQFGGGGRGGGGRGGRGRGGGGDSIGRAMEHTELSMKEHGGESKSDIIAAMGVTLAFRLEVATGATDQQLNTWCQRQSVSRERIQAIVDLEEHIKFELGTFMPFRDVDDPSVLLQQMGRLRPVVSAMICTAFAAQALEVTAEGSMQFKVKEGASGIFTNLSAMPDLHTPSCIRWNVGEVVIPVTLSLRYSHLLGSYTTCVDGLKSFYISCVLFAHSLNYEIFEDENGQYYEFMLTFHGRSRVLEANKDTGSAIIMFRSQLQTICQQLSQIRTQQAERNATAAGGATSDEAQQAQVLAMSDLQRKVVAALQGFFFGAGFEKLELNEIQPGDETIDRRSTLTF